MHHTLFVAWFLFGIINRLMNSAYSSVQLLPPSPINILPPIGLPPSLPWRTNRSNIGSEHTDPPKKRRPVINMAITESTTLATVWTNVSRGQLYPPSTNPSDQSGPCTPEEDEKAIQCLRELPAERYEVLEGEDVHMRCRVAHQKGKAQWRARSFLLGKWIVLARNIFSRRLLK